MFWCCCGTPTEEQIDPIPGSIVCVFNLADYLASSAEWNPISFVPVREGSYAYNLPSAPLLPTGAANTLGTNFSQRSVMLGRKRGVWNPSGTPELSSGNLHTFECYAWGYLYQRFDVAQGTAIARAELVMQKAPQITEPPNAITASVRVLSSVTLPSVAYPWLPNQYAVTSTINGTYTAPVDFTITPDTTTVDLTSQVQSVVSNAGWSSLNNYLTLLIYTRYPQANLWVNSIHPGGNYPSYPASNTAVWFSDPGTTTTQPAIGAKVRIVLA